MNKKQDRRYTRAEFMKDAKLIYRQVSGGSVVIMSDDGSKEIARIETVKSSSQEEK